MSVHQQSLFDREPPPWEADDESEQLVASVVFSRGPQRTFDYLVPDELRADLAPGQRVKAPFGRQNHLLSGYCVRLETLRNNRRSLKELAGIVDEQSLLNPAMLRLVEWMADYYLCAWGQAMEAVLPAGVRDQAGTRETRLVSLPTHIAARLTTLKLTPVQQRILTSLAARTDPVPIQELVAAVGCTVGPIQTLAKKQWLEITTRRMDTGELAAAPDGRRDNHLALNPDQRQALDLIAASLRAREHNTILVHGVTGSGKTEVYIQAIDEVLSYGRQAIVLVPEISLTPQTEERFRSRFGNVAVLHSHLSDVERRRHWEQIAAARVSVVVGARSAVFAPAPNLGLIVIDEEHETTFKQDIAPRYHAREVARERARDLRIPLVLGSATPSLESYQRALDGEFSLISLPRRVYDRQMPDVLTVDLRVEFQDRHSRGSISRPLHAAMDATLKQGGQVILLLNRRGFSTHIQCPSCGLVVECPHCAIALTHHLQSQLAICHYCDYQTQAPTACDRCNFQGIQYRGLGTQRLEAEVKARFPNFSCLRMDADTMRKPGSHERALARFREGEARILLGTQMIAKGLDFPNVTLVGVVNADIALHLADFRAAERTFQLVTQVAGRTGRGDKGGRVLVQTFSPEHVAIVAATKHDYEAFASNELPLRKAHGYPPYTKMFRLVFRGAAELTTGELANQVAGRLRAALAQSASAWRVLGPAPAPLAKLRGQYRFQLQVQGDDGQALRDGIQTATATLKPPEGVQWMVDVDPHDMQ